MNKIVVSILLCLTACQVTRKDEMKNHSYMEKYRPQFHFSPDHNWTNDPNGLIYIDGEYHIFYQYNPYGNTWGHMSWGHSVSSDLLHWKHLPVAITEYENHFMDSTMIFSGTVVADTHNTSGLGNDGGCLVSIYTSHVHAKGKGLKQHQSLAFSTDKGRTWKQYENNPILDIHKKDFRDPKVFWYEPEKKWVMVLVIPDLFKVQIYESGNLLQWKLLSEFGPQGDTSKIWECPDLFEIAIENSNEKKWMLSLSGNHPAGGKFVGMQYFIGQFNGEKFIPDNPKPIIQYVDFGKDYYAGITFNNLPSGDGRVIMMGWNNNWAYANKVPTSPWRGSMALPRELILRKSNDSYILIQKPIRELNTIKGEPLKKGESAASAEIMMTIEIKQYVEAGIKVFKSKAEETVIGYNTKTEMLFLDRTRSGNILFHPDFSSREELKVKPVDGKIKLQILLDQSVIEVFVNDGYAAFAELAFPMESDYLFESYQTEKGEPPSMVARHIKSVWTSEGKNR